jgi:hypothetical protein
MRTITSILSFLSLSFSRCIFTIILLTPGLVFALKESPKELSRPNQGFIENKGQIIDQNHKPNPAVLYLLNMPGMNVQLRRGGFSYDIYRISNIDKHTQNNELNHHGNTAPLHHGIKDSIPQPPSSIIDFHRIDLDLVGINSDYTIESGGATSDYTNYYLGFTPREGIQNVRSFKKIIYRNIYPNIDLDFSADDKHIFKYTFIIHPGARLCDIQILVSEPSILQLEKDTLVFHTTLGDITENIPECFMTEKDSIISIKGFFRQITSNIYGFSTDLVVPDGATLVLDPSAVRLWGTYYGGPAVEYTANSTVDGLGNSFITGSTWSDINIATAGAYQTARASLALSGFIVKFNPAGVRQWGTYYGSTKGESIYGSAGDNLGNIYVVGVTMSDTGMATPGAHQDSCGCSINSTMDAFIAKFSPNGWRIWGTYYGWEGTDYIFSVAPDNYGNVFVVGQTSSSQNIATPGSYRDTYEGYNSSFLVKFDTSGVRLWGSYYTGNDLRYCAVDADGNLYATGSTGSDTAVASPGAYQTTKGGEYDAFLIAFSTTGERLWSTYYGGSLDDYGESCNVDSANNIYIAGYTESPDGIASPGSHQETFGGLWDGFIAKFNSSGQRLWGSYYGGAGSDVIHSCSGGSFGDIFFSGETNSINNISTANSFMPDYAGAGDAYLVKFNINGERQWGTYFGGTGWDQNSTCSYIAEDTIYLGGQTMSTSNISTPNGHQPVIGGQKDAYLIKFIDCRPISMAQPIIGPADICKNTTGVNYSTSSLAHAVNYVWNLPPGATLTSGAGTTNITVDFSSSANSGYISVKGLNKCGDAGDSASLYINLHARPVPVISGEVNPCTGPQYIYSTESGKSNYQWSLSPGGNITAGGSVADNTVTIVWISGGPQWIRVNYTDTNNCNALVPTP